MIQQAKVTFNQSVCVIFHNEDGRAVVNDISIYSRRIITDAIGGQTAKR